MAQLRRAREPACPTCESAPARSSTRAGTQWRKRLQRKAASFDFGACLYCDGADAPAEREADRTARAALSGERVEPTAESARGGTLDGALRSTLESAAGGGAQLPDTMREMLEPRLGADLGDVRVHADGHAHRLATQLGAEAFTYGPDIYFRKGAYDPASQQGREMLAHEVVHTVQQRDAEPAIQRQEHDDEQAAARQRAREQEVLEAHVFGGSLDPASRDTWRQLEGGPSPRIHSTVAAAFGREQELFGSLGHISDEAAIRDRLGDILRLEALSMMAAHRSHVAFLADEQTGAERSDATRSEAVAQARVAIAELRSLRGLRFQTEYRGSRLEQAGTLTRQPTHASRQELTRELRRLIRLGTEPFAGDETRRHLDQQLLPELRRGATIGRMRYLVVRTANELAANRARELVGLEAATNELVSRFPFLADLTDAEVGVGEWDIATQFAVSRSESVGPGEAIDIARLTYGESLDRAADQALHARMAAGYRAVLHNIDDAIVRIGRGSINPFDMPLVVGSVREQLSGSPREVFESMRRTHEAVAFWLPLGLTALQAAVTFVPVVGPVLGLAVGLASTGLSMRDILNRQAMAQASIEEDRSLGGMEAPTGTDWILEGVNAVLTVFDLAEVVAALRGGARAAGAAEEIGEDILRSAEDVRPARVISEEAPALRASEGAAGSTTELIARSHVDERVLASRQHSLARHRLASGHTIHIDVDGHIWLCSDCAWIGRRFSEVLAGSGLEARFVEVEALADAAAAAGRGSPETERAVQAARELVHDLLAREAGHLPIDVEARTLTRARRAGLEGIPAARRSAAQEAELRGWPAPMSPDHRWVWRDVRGSRVPSHELLPGRRAQGAVSYEFVPSPGGGGQMRPRLHDLSWSARSA